MVELTEEQKNAIFEQNFPCRGMSRDERQICLNIISNCKEISDTDYKVDGQNKCELLQMSFEKKDSEIAINGTVSIGDKTKEARCIDGSIYIDNSTILVDMHVVRVCSDALFNEYFVVDEFKMINGELVRESYYDYDMKKIRTKIDDNGIKGKLK